MIVKIVDINKERIGLLQPLLIPEISCKVGNILNEINIATAGNSFGFMDGGVDLVISTRYRELENKVKESINNRPLKELLVGEAIPMKLDDGKILIYAPTMRVPMILKDSINVYLSMKAILLKAIDLELSEISIPILGGGVGQLPINVIAIQINQAYCDVFKIYQKPNTWWEASIKHQKLYNNNIVDLQK